MKKEYSKIECIFQSHNAIEMYVKFLKKKVKNKNKHILAYKKELINLCDKLNFAHAQIDDLKAEIQRLKEQK